MSAEVTRPVAKEAIYSKIADFVKGKTGKNIGRSGGRLIFDMVVEEIFAAATKEGTFRLNGGFGSFHVKQYQSGSRRLPKGDVVNFGEREKLRYEAGVVVEALIREKGDLTKVQEARQKAQAEAASSTKPEELHAAPTEVKAKRKGPQAVAPAADEESSELNLD